MEQRCRFQGCRIHPYRSAEFWAHFPSEDNSMQVEEAKIPPHQPPQQVIWEPRDFMEVLIQNQIDRCPIHFQQYKLVKDDVLLLTFNPTSPPHPPLWKEESIQQKPTTPTYHWKIHLPPLPPPKKMRS